MNRVILLIVLLLPLTLPSYGQTVSLSLEDCQVMAADNNPNVKNKYIDILAARAQRKEVAREALPILSFNALGVISDNPFIEYVIGNDISDLIHEFNIGASNKGYTMAFSAIQPIYLGGRISTGKKLAKLGIDAADLKYKIELRTSKEDIEKAYWEIVALEEKRKTLNHLDSLLTVLEKDVASGMEAGVITSTDMMMVKMKKNELKSGKIKLEGGLNLLKMNLFNNIGQNYSFTKAAADSSKPFINDIYLSDRLDTLLPPEEYYIDEHQMAAGVDETQLLGMLVQSKKLEKKIARGEALPIAGVGVNASYAQFSTGMGKFNGAIMAIVRVPITQWAKTSQKLKRMDYEIQKAQNEKDYLESQLLLQIRQFWYNLNVAWEQMQVAKDNVAIAEKTVSDQIAEYNAGMIPLKDLLMTQTTLFEAAEGFINSQIEYSKALTAYTGRQ